jgi:hypothetical protein
MKQIVLLLVSVVLFAGTVPAQEASVAFHPGESVHILVKLEAVAPVENAAFYFGLVTQPDKGQELLGRGITGNQFNKVSDAQFEITATIPEHVVSGTFKLSWISITIKGVGKQYNEGSDFKAVNIAIVNPERPQFPKIDDVKVAPRN